MTSCWQRPLALVFIVFRLVSGPGWHNQNNEETLKNASTVLSAMIDSKSVPSDLLARTYCVVVLPGVKKFGFGGSGGRGPMSSRGDDDFRGSWSAPAMYSLSGATGNDAKGNGRHHVWQDQARQ
jgi:lipid-binding SYLF domain-containing protein